MAERVRERLPRRGSPRSGSRAASAGRQRGQWAGSRLHRGRGRLGHLRPRLVGARAACGTRCIRVGLLSRARRRGQDARRGTWSGRGSGSTGSCPSGLRPTGFARSMRGAATPMRCAPASPRRFRCAATASPRSSDGLPRSCSPPPPPTSPARGSRSTEAQCARSERQPPAIRSLGRQLHSDELLVQRLTGLRRPATRSSATCALSIRY